LNQYNCALFGQIEELKGASYVSISYTRSQVLRIISSQALWKHKNICVYSCIFIVQFCAIISCPDQFSCYLSYFHIGRSLDAFVSDLHFEKSVFYPQASQYEIYGGQSGIGMIFSSTNFFLPCQYHSIFLIFVIFPCKKKLRCFRIGLTFRKARILSPG